MNKYLLPISGHELTFKQHSVGFKDHIMGSNCYSYAMNHHLKTGIRPNKSVPGDISGKHAWTDWQTCGNAIHRIMKDGERVRDHFKLKMPYIRKVAHKKKTAPRYRKIVLVVESDAAPKGTPTDFHFYAQNRMSAADLYNVERISSKRCKKNPYNILGVRAFISNMQLKKRGITIDPVKRAKMNINLHIDMIPEYMIDFMIDPFWILSIDANKRTSFDVCERADILKSKAGSPLHKKVIDIAKQQSLKILRNGKYCEYDMSKPIGLWSHKLGWGTRPLNTDGNNKLIFDPAKACRDHGSGYDYDTVCQTFEVLTGWGTSSNI